MGLDMYLNAKSKRLKSKETSHTGACGGLFPLAPKKEAEEVEIGYWRKAYDVQELIMEYVELGESGDDNCVPFPLGKTTVEDILAIAKENFEEYKDFADEESEEGWKAYQWGKTVEIFTRAVEIYAADPDAEITYLQWY